MVEVSLQGRTYDTNDWIPVTPSQLQTSASDIVEQKTASDRVLSLDVPAQKFFPDGEYDYRKRRPNQGQQSLRDLPVKKGMEPPRPRKLKHPSEYNFETPPPPPSKTHPQINYYNGQTMSPYTFDQSNPTKVSKPINQQLYYVPNQQLPQQQLHTNNYPSLPNLAPQVPALQSSSPHQPHHLPFNSSFYQSFNPATLNNDFYQAISNSSQIIQKQSFPGNVPQQNINSQIIQQQSLAGNVPQQNSPTLRRPATPSQHPKVEESVQLVYVPVENLKSNQQVLQNTRNVYQSIETPRQEGILSNGYQQASQTADFKPIDEPRQGKFSYEFQNLQHQPTPDFQPVDSPRQEKLVAGFKPVDQLQQEQISYQLHNAQQQSRPNFQQLDSIKQETLNSFEPVDQPRQEKLVYDPPHLQERPEFSYQQINPSKQNNPVSSKDVVQNKQHRLENIQQDFIQRALEAHKLQQQLQDEINPLKQEQSPTTPKSNRKPHQPPLAVFLESDKKAEISDVLNILRGAQTISVQDAVTADSPKIFVGPSNLDSPEGYTKFPLPYLNNINGNRIERKIEQLPFFVAPVSYRAPPGYSKISLPSPHVGSVVVSVPITTSTTPEPLYHTNLNPFTPSSFGYSSLDSPTPSRPLKNYLNNYETSNQERTRYHSTTSAPPVTEGSLSSQVRNVFDSQFPPSQPEVYYTQQNSQQPHRENVPLLDIYNPHLQENTRYSSSEENSNLSPSTISPIESTREDAQLPDVNPLELAINEFELHQINSQFEQPNRKVKHSTTRRPQVQNNYEDSQTVSSTRAPTSRGRQTHANDHTTEKPVSRGRVRGRARSRTTTTTSSTTTPAPSENERYTVLEEFVAREPIRDSTSESNGRFSVEAETNAPRRSSTPINSNEYSPERSTERAQQQLEFQNNYYSQRPHDASSDSRQPISSFDINLPQSGFDGRFDNRRPQSTFESNPSQVSVNENFEDPRHQYNFENVRSQTQFDGSSESKQPQIQYDSRPEIQLDNTYTQNKFDSIHSQTGESEIPKTTALPLLENKNPQTIDELNQFYQGNSGIENNPASVYSLKAPQNYDSTAFDFDSNRETSVSTKQVFDSDQTNENINSEITKTPRTKERSRPANSHRFSPDVVHYENREPNQIRYQGRPDYQEVDSNINGNTDIKQRFESDTYRSPSSENADQSPEEQRPKQQSINDAAGFLENLNQPNFDQTYLSLQDQAVRSLLTPNLLAPSTPSQQKQIHSHEEVLSSTESIVEIPSSTQAETTTTARATRTRGRGRTRATTPSTATSSPRRTSSRRRPISRTSTERISSSTEYSSRENTEKINSDIRQNFRTRSRPAQNEISDRISTTENDVRAFKQPALESGFEAFNNQGPPQSYMQFEHAIDEQQIITINPNLNQETEVKEYHQLYSSPTQTSTDKQHIVLEYENTKPRPVLDIQVSHIMPEDSQRNSDIITGPTEDEQYVRYNANIKSGGVLNNNKPVTTTRVPTTKTKGRTRGRSRFATSPRTTSRPVTRISPSNTLKTTTQEPEEPENYGFIRQPSYVQKNIQAQNTVQSSSRNEEPSVQFVGEIRPKYTSRKATSQSKEESDIAETPRPRIRSRTRAPSRQTTNSYKHSNNEASSSKSTEQVTRRSGSSRGRVRGSSHYRAPDYQKRESDDEDVANQNYPINFLQKLDASSPKPTTAAFQITIDPLDQDSEDQSPHSSIYRPKFIYKPDGWSDPNALPSEDKPVTPEPEEVTLADLAEALFSTEEPQALPVAQTTENSEEFYTHFADNEVSKVMINLEKIETSPTESPLATEPTEEPTTKQKSRRKGVWKLVRQRPLDPLEASESQNYQSVLNIFNSIEKVDPYTKSNSHTEKLNEKPSFNKDMPDNNFNPEIDHLKIDNYDENGYFENGESVAHKFVEEVATEPTETETTNTEYVTDSNSDDILTTTPSTLKTQENIFDTIYEMFGIFNKHEMKNNDTDIASSTSTSYTEDSENDSPTTTMVNPVFPEEITEESSSSNTEKLSETYLYKDADKEEDIDDKEESTERITATTLEVKPSTKPYEVEPWKMRAVKKSTSTEVTHETEICYKGRCVKSKDKKH